MPVYTYGWLSIFHQLLWVDPGSMDTTGFGEEVLDVAKPNTSVVMLEHRREFFALPLSTKTRTVRALDAGH